MDTYSYSDKAILEELGKRIKTLRLNKNITQQELADSNYNEPGLYGYEQVFQIMRTLKLSKKDDAQFFKRMVFNVISTNLDDHTKNIS